MNWGLVQGWAPPLPDYAGMGSSDPPPAQDKQEKKKMDRIEKMISNLKNIQVQDK